MQAKNYLLLTLSLVGIGILFFIGPIPQDACYHNFFRQANIIWAY